MQLFTPVTRKENNSILQKVSRRLQDAKKDIPLSALKKHVKYSLLYKNESQQWRMVNQQGSAQVPHGDYSYICTTSGVLRIHPIIDNKTNHLMLAEYADAVRYAGTVRFEHGKLIVWDNDSGGYQPEADRLLQARLPLSLFKEEGNSPVGKKNKEFDALSTKQAKQPEVIAIDIISQAYLHYKKTKTDASINYKLFRNKVRHKVNVLEMQAVSQLDAVNQFVSPITA